MESDSILSALVLTVSFILLAVSEMGSAAIAGRLRASMSGSFNGREESVSAVRSSSVGTDAPFRLLSRVSYAAAMFSVASFALAVWGTQWFVVVGFALAALCGLIVVVFLSRSAGIKWAETLFPFMSWLARMTSFPLWPFLLLYSRIGRRPPPDSDAGSDRAFGYALPASGDHEPLDEREMRMIRGVVRLDKTVAREIMVPRVDIAAVAADESLDTLAEEMDATGHSRIPIFEDSLDQIRGIAHARDVLQQLTSGRNLATTAGEVGRPPLFIPESKTLEELLEEFQQTQMHLAVVVDEYGGVSGIVTIEDLLEEIVGEIRDEFDNEEPGIRKVGDSEFMVDARLPIEELNEALGIDVVGDGFDTIGGFVFDRLGKIPIAGDRVRYDGIRIEVTNTTGRRPTTLRISRDGQ